MSEGINDVTLAGFVGAPPQLRYTKSGEPVLSLRIATSEGYIDRNRERRERTDWHDVTIWGRRGEALAKIVGKGQQLAIKGSLRTSSWKAADGSTRYRTTVAATRIVLGQRPKGAVLGPTPPPPHDPETGEIADDVPEAVE